MSTPHSPKRYIVRIVYFEREKEVYEVSAEEIEERLLNILNNNEGVLEIYLNDICIYFPQLISLTIDQSQRVIWYKPKGYTKEVKS